MRRRIAFVLIVLSVGVYVCAQEGIVEHGWTDKNNTEMYAAYLLQHAYCEQGYWESKVEIRQAGTNRIFVVQPGRIYHVERFDVSRLSNLPQDAMADAPNVGDVYSPVRVNEWIATIEKKYGRRVNWGSEFDRVHAQVIIEVNNGPIASPNDPRR